MLPFIKPSCQRLVWQTEAGLGSLKAAHCCIVSATSHGAAFGMDPTQLDSHDRLTPTG